MRDYNLDQWEALLMAKSYLGGLPITHLT